MILCSLSTLCHFYCADPSACTPQVANIQKMQRSLLDAFMGTPSCEYKNWESLLLFFTCDCPEVFADDVCLWRGVECDGGFIRAIAILFTGRWNTEIYIVNLHWVPPTTRVFSIKSVSILANWHMESLPRDLRLFSLHDCRTYHDGEDDPKQLNFRVLPPKIEEFYIMGHHCKRMRVLIIDNVPDTLRWLQLTNSYLHKVYVACDDLPESVRRMCFRSQSAMTVKIRGIGGSVCDMRALNADSWFFMKNSSSYREYLP